MPKALPDNTIVYPAHDYNGVRSSTIAKEKGANPFLRENDKEAFVKILRSKVLTKPFNMDNIVRVNRTGEATRLAMISPKDSLALLEKEARYKLIDVRSPLEYNEVHIKGSINIPMDMVALKLSDCSRNGRPDRLGARISCAPGVLCCECFCWLRPHLRGPY